MFLNRVRSTKVSKRSRNSFHRKLFTHRSYAKGHSSPKMKALQVHRYSSSSSGWRIAHVDKPSRLAKGEILVKVKSAALNPLDLEMANGYGKQLFASAGVKLPFTPGRECSGIVQDIGNGVWDLKKGDEVMCCLDPFDNPAALAEYVKVSQYCAVVKPPKLTHDQASALPFCGLTTASVVHDVSLKEGSKVLVIGTGGVGYFAIQLLKKVHKCDIRVVGPERMKEDIEKMGIKYYCYENEFIDIEDNSLDFVFDAASMDQRDAIEDYAVPFVKQGGHYTTLSGDLVRNVDSSNNVLLGLGKGYSNFSLKQADMYQKYGINYHWGIYKTNYQQLKNIAKWATDGSIQSPPTVAFHVDQYEEALYSKGKVVINF
eukprot:TRINITY_DN8889_c0_g1_i1.p1 TRINITY_DN8889_c0_g1~~TRINITY_DN8889_c0_g1_i1.p1  ORF type:complete len:372 (+),score=81.94 TRINITY_DN8889_c0_g1_i1:19-1134(+)